MQTSILCIGADISKAEVVVSVAGGRPCTVANNTAAITRWLRTVPEHAHIAMESTGRYHALLAQIAHVHGLTVYILNARDVFFYARATGARGKTDDIAAGLIARYLEAPNARLPADRKSHSTGRRM